MLVITNKGYGRWPVDGAEKRMLEDQVFETLFTMSCTQLFERLPGAVEIFDRGFLFRHLHGIDGLRGFDLHKPRRNYECRDKSPEETDSARFSVERPLQILDHTLFDEAQVMDDLADTPFTLGGPLHEDLRIKRHDGVQQFLMDHIQPLQRSIHKC